MRSLCLLLLLATFSALSTVAEAAQYEASVELAAVGDILLDRRVARKIASVGESRAFAGVRESIASADLALGNLECPLTQQCQPSSKRIAFRADPRMVEALSGAGFDILSLANNHSMDCGTGGLLETMRNLRESGLAWSGAGPSRAQAEAPLILNVKGIRIAIVSFTAIAPVTADRPPEDDGPSVAIMSRDSFLRALAYARTQADVIVASLHWGTEYASRPGAEQRETARLAARAGADLIVGHHTHSLQGMELIASGEGARKRYSLAAYSLGNFAFDSPRALGRRVTESAILRCRFDRRGLISAEVIPITLDNYLPRPARPDEAQSILLRLGALSAELNTLMTGGRVIMQK